MARGAARRILAPAALVAAAAVGLGLWLTAPAPLPAGGPADDFRADEAAAARGETWFNAGSCASCHAAPGAEGEEKLVLAGGRRITTEFGTFLVPNISPHPAAGIGGWTPKEFADALLRGVSPSGSHLYPAFPWPSYARMPVEDALDLLAYLRTLRPSPEPSRPHELDFPFSIRLGVGAWKLLYFHPEPVVAEGLSEQAERGRMLVEGVAHCGECHTPRDALGGPRYDAWLAGGPNPDGPGVIPNITPGGKDVSGWSESDIVYYLQSGFTPDYDTAGGSMVAVIEGVSKLPEEDLAAIAAYLKAIPAVE